MANNAIANIFRIKELRDRVFFTLIILAVFRLGCVLPIPGINPRVLLGYFKSIANNSGVEGTFANYMNFFAGGAFEKFSVFMLGIMPYISTQIILQLALIIFPGLKKAAQEEGGQRRVATWTRVGTVVVCLIQAVAVTAYIDAIQANPGSYSFEDGSTVAFKNIVYTSFTNPYGFKALAVLAVTTGAMITVWLGDQITAKGIGNGISVLIFAGIVARLPEGIKDLWSWMTDTSNGSVDNTRVIAAIIVALVFVVIIALVIYEQQGVRKIPVNYAKRVVGRKMYGGQSTYIPFKINPSGVIPVIFASSFLTFPLQVIQSFAAKDPDANQWINKLANVLTPRSALYNVILVLLIVFFAYFYTQVTLNPTEIAKNIRENGGSIPGIRPDKTESYMQKILNRLVLPGSLYLAFIAVIPSIVVYAFDGFPMSTAMLMGGTSLLILVGVDLDTMSQIESILKMHHSEGLVKKGKLRSRNL